MAYRRSFRRRRPVRAVRRRGRAGRRIPIGFRL